MSVLQVKFQEAFALHQNGQLDQAKVIYEDILTTEPNHADALHLLGVVAFQTNNPQRAVELISRAIDYNPSRDIFHFNHGNALVALKQLESAVESYGRAIGINSNFVQAYVNRGNALVELKLIEKAVESYYNATAIKPDCVEAYFSLGVALQMLMRYQEALENYDKAINIKPDYAQAYFNRSYTLQAMGQLEAAIDNLNKAISIKPDFADAYVNRGLVLQSIKQLDGAVESYNHAIHIKPDFAEAYFNRGNALQELGQLEASVTSYKTAFNIKPDFEYLLGMLLNAKMHLCDWTDLQENIADLVRRVDRNEKSSTGFPALSLITSPAIHRQIAEIWLNDKYPFNGSLGDIPKHTRSGKIRIGYFSADFHVHPALILLAELFEYHEKNYFELIAFSFGPDINDEMRQRIQPAFDQFIDVRDKTDEEIAFLVRQMKVDIAIDLGGATVNARTGIFSHRAAPIQVNYLGYPGTMAADYFDYIVADQTIIPKESQQYYAEKIVYLPNSYQPNDSKRVISNKEFTRQELDLPSEGFVFCCFNHHYKIMPNIFDGWMRILKAAPASVLLLYADKPTAEKNLRREAEARGVDSSRLIFAKRVKDRSDYLARYRAVDLFLDTFPYNAHATASDALWAGLPILTLAGETFASRVGASLLNAIELPELITVTQEDYEALAIELASHPTKLKSIKTKLASNRLTTPLFNTPLFTQHIERAYTQMVERYHADLKPDHIYVE